MGLLKVDASFIKCCSAFFCLVCATVSTSAESISLICRGEKQTVSYLPENGSPSAGVIQSDHIYKIEIGMSRDVMVASKSADTRDFIGDNLSEYSSMLSSAVTLNCQCGPLNFSCTDEYRRKPSEFILSCNGTGASYFIDPSTGRFLTTQGVFSKKSRTALATFGVCMEF